MVFSLISPINAGFMISVMVFIIYWSFTLTDRAIIERIGGHGLRFFGSMRRIVVAHYGISLAIGSSSFIVDPTTLSDYLVANLIIMPLFLIAGIYFLRANHVDLQLAMWNHSNSMRRGALDTDKFVHDMTELIRGMHNIHRLEPFFRAYVEMNPAMIPVLRTAMQRLEAENKIPTSLLLLLTGLLTQQ